MIETSPSATSGRFQVLDSLRGLSALAVVIYHALTDQLSVRNQVEEAPLSASLLDWVIYILSSGFLGVPVFFMISGYCISAAAENHIKKGYSPLRFLYRRFVRIYPPYWICLLLCLLLSWIPGTRIEHEGLTLTQWAGNFLLFEKYRHWFLPPAETKQILGISWTLCYEEQFYLLTLLVIVLLPRRLGLIFAVLTSFVILNTYNLNIGPLKRFGDLNRFHVNLTDLLFDEFWLLFATGIGLYYYRNTRAKFRYVFPLTLLVFAWWEIRQLDWYTYRYISRVFTIVVVLALSLAGRWDAHLMRIGALSPLTWLGQRSYSIYLVHMPITFFILYLAKMLGYTSKLSAVAVVVPIAVVLSLLAGCIFFTVVERRFIPEKAVAA